MGTVPSPCKRRGGKRLFVIALSILPRTCVSNVGSPSPYVPIVSVHCPLGLWGPLQSHQLSVTALGKGIGNRMTVPYVR